METGDRIKKELLSYGKDKTRLKLKEERLKEIRENLVQPATILLERGGGGSGEERISAGVAAADELEREIKALKRRIERISIALEILDEEERAIVEQSYIKRKPGNIKTLCAELHKDRSSVFRSGNRALGKIAELLRDEDDFEH